jgi:uncharacterized protein RhaS with RHS repeats
MQARYYDPVIGRFYSNDPVGTLGHFSQGNIHGFNRYAYANNNPYKYTDPNGELLHTLIGGVVGAVVNVGISVISGNTSGEQITGAVVGGFTTGALVANGAPLPMANAVGGSVGNAVEQYANVATGKQDSVSGGQVATAGLISAAVGKLPSAKVQSVTAGRGNMGAVFKGQITKWQMEPLGLCLLAQLVRG